MRQAHLSTWAIRQLLFLLPVAAYAQTVPPDALQVPAIKSFIGEGFGTRNPKAPPELDQFGRLVGVWRVQTEMRAQDDTWHKSAPGLWTWKYDLDGFAVRDLWFQSAARLPVYMGHLGRDYLLTANRIYDVAGKKWQVAWMANGAGQVMGADFGIFTAVLENDEIVMLSPPGNGTFGLQRVVFYEITDDSFRWKSDYSADKGESWNTVMRLHATRASETGTSDAASH